MPHKRFFPYFVALFMLAVEPKGKMTVLNNQDAKQYLINTAEESRTVKTAFLQECGDRIIDASRLLADCFRQNGKVLIFGNGGSAADAQHMAAEFVGRMLIERKALAAIALTTDSSNLTAIGNDYGYESVFSRQIEALAVKGDVVVAISTSGSSKNVIAALTVAKKKGCKVIGLSGARGSKLAEMSDIALEVGEGKNSARIQEGHIFAIHSMVDLVDRFFLKN